MSIIENNTPKRAPLTDVAKQAGVSIKTVSRVMRKEAYVKQSTVDKVTQVADKLGYRPVQAVRSRSSSRSFLIGLIYDNPTSLFVAELMSGALDEARREGYHLVIDPCKDIKDPEYLNQLKNFVIQANIDGVVLGPPMCDQLDVLQTLKELNIPYARISPSVRLDSGLNVHMDDYRAAREITRLLIGHGHQDIAFLTLGINTSAKHKRLSGFRDEMNDAGQPINEHNILEGNGSYKSGLDCAEKLLSCKPYPSAIFASNDMMASAVIAVAHKYNIAIPAQLSVAGFDDSAIAKAIWPPLTTVKQPIYDMAASAVNLLVTRALRADKYDGTRFEHHLSFEIIERDSTGKYTQKT